MTPTELLFKLKNMPADTPITAEHIIAILGAMQAPQTISNNPGSYSTWDNDKYIDAETLAEWIGEPTERLKKWRLDGLGPKFVKKPKHIAYRVGDVRDWMNSRTVQSTSQADKFSFVSAFDDCFVEPTIYHDDKPYSLFESIELYGNDEETNITGFEVFITKDPLASLYMQGNLDTLLKADDINKVQSYFINGKENKGTVAHLISQYPIENMQEWLPEFLNIDLNFEIKDSNGKSAIEYGEYNLNNYLNKRDLMLKFQNKFGAKQSSDQEKI